MAAGRGRRVLLTSLLGVVAVGLTGISPGLAAGGAGHARKVRAYTTGIDAPDAAVFRDQTLDWKPCIDSSYDPGLPSAYYSQQCTTLTAPMDWNDPGDGRTIKIAVSRLPATRSPAAGALFTNPGGPGGSGINLPLLFLSAGRKAITRSQDVYGIDTRGTGLSSNTTCAGPATSLLDPRDRSAANLDLIMDGAAMTARTCLAAGGDFIKLVNTEQTVQDYNLLRAVIGVEKINWLGYSAGSWLGAYYAQRFPSHVGHMVLDSNTDFSSGWQQAFELQPLGFERRFRQDFAPWVARWDRYYKLGSTAEQVIASYERIRAGMTTAKPVDSPVVLDQTIAGAMYSRYMFPLAALILDDIAAAVSATSKGEARAAARAYARADVLGKQVRRSQAYLSRQPMSSDAGDATFLAVTCNDTPWTRSRTDLVTKSGMLGAQYPLLGYSAISDPCYFWNRPVVSLTPPTGAGSPPILMVQAEKDPATPIEGARKAAASYAGAHLLVVEGEGDHGIYAGGNSCVDAAVEKFIVSGTLPEAGATCNALPLPTPESYGYGYFAKGSTKLTPADDGAARTTRAGLPVRGTNPILALQTLDTKLTAHP